MGKSSKPRASSLAAKARAREAGTKSWIALGIAALIGLVVWLLEIILLGAYLAPVFSRGWLWFGATILMAIGLPVAIAVWLVRPLQGFKRAAWFVGVCLIVPVLAVVGLSLGAPRHSANLLRRHGHWPIEQIFGPPTRSSTTRAGERLAHRWAALLKRAPKKKVEGPKTARKPGKRAKPRKPPKSVFYSGVRRAPRTDKGLSPARGRKIQLRFVQRGGAIMLRATVRHRRRRQKVSVILDTGATLSTIDSATAKKLGVELPKAPIKVELQTAAGPRTFPVTVLDRVRLGRADVRNLTVAICDPCSPPGLQGLIGLNFTQHFVTTIDSKRKRLTLHRHKGRQNRIIDIESFLHLKGVQGETTPETFSVQGKVVNRGARRVRDLEIEAVLLDTRNKVLGRMATRIKHLKGRGTQDFELTGKTHKELVRYRLELKSARW